MDILIEILRSLPPRLSLFIFALIIMGGGIYGWRTLRTDINLYDAAMGKAGKTVDARVYLKNTESRSSNSGKGSTYLAHYFLLTYDIDGEHYQETVYVSGDEYNSVKEDEIIKIHYHPDHPKYLVTPKMARPSAWFGTIVSVFALLLGLSLALAVIYSLF
jgi:hypothetical protein